jgi:uncharacterized membrane protein
MKKIILLLAVSAFLYSCSGKGSDTSSSVVSDSVAVTETQSDNYELEGLYAPSFILSCANNEKIVLKSDNKKLDSLYKVLLPNAYQGQTVYVKVKGTLFSTNGTAKAFTVNEVITAEQKNPRNTCYADDFWCIGNEPFWNVQVSEKENLIDFFNPMEAKYYHFVYAKPAEKRKSKVYTSENSVGGHKIKVTITPGNCSDGMSEREFIYSSEVVLDGNSYTGCAVSSSQSK